MATPKRIFFRHAWVYRDAAYLKSKFHKARQLRNPQNIYLDKSAQITLREKVGYSRSQLLPCRLQNIVYSILKLWNLRRRFLINIYLFIYLFNFRILCLSNEADEKLQLMYISSEYGNYSKWVCILHGKIMVMIRHGKDDIFAS